MSTFRRNPAPEPPAGQPPADPEPIEYAPENLGLVAGRVEGAMLGVDVPPNFESKIDHPGQPVVANVAFKTGKTTVPPQDSALITLDFMCSALPGIAIDPARAVEQITGSINKPVPHWKLWPVWAFNANTGPLPVVDVVSAHNG